MDQSLLDDAAALLRDPDVDVIDLHLDTYIASRIARRDLQKRHRTNARRVIEAVRP